MDLKPSIESILFVRGEPISAARLSRLTGRPKADVIASLRELCDEYRDRGIVLLENGEDWQLVTHPAAKSIIESLVTADLGDDLSKAALEVLAIVAYKGPLTRVAIEYIRGVNSSFTVRNLLVRGLIEREDNPSDKRSYLYRIASDFLKHLGLGRIEDIPEYAALRQTPVEAPEERDPADAPGRGDAP